MWSGPPWPGLCHNSPGPSPVPLPQTPGVHLASLLCCVTLGKALPSLGSCPIGPRGPSAVSSMETAPQPPCSLGCQECPLSCLQPRTPGPSCSTPPGLRLESTHFLPPSGAVSGQVYKYLQMLPFLPNEFSAMCHKLAVMGMWRAGSPGLRLPLEDGDEVAESAGTGPCSLFHASGGIHYIDRIHLCNSRIRILC